jgi:CheY-like chemotaxis protein
VLVAVTGWGRDGDRQRAFAAGFDHHLTKPMTGEALQSLLGSLPNCSWAENLCDSDTRDGSEV